MKKITITGLAICILVILAAIAGLVQAGDIDGSYSCHGSCKGCICQAAQRSGEISEGCCGWCDFGTPDEPIVTLCCLGDGMCVKVAMF